jgi:DNA topoisomerase-2|uniref:DNA topoisomerase (ATP-hydrolyzing) n=1 Tax=viral metagenome TaxID=1070528 RepID=A0A6C0JCB9_9ZZZZ
MESVQKLTHVEHVLKRPDSYVGPVDKTHESYWLLNNTNNNFQKKNISYSPALLKIFDEILVNAIDRNSLHPKNVTQIAVSVDKETGEVTIENNGPLGGISVRMHEKEGIWNPELVFGHLLTSTNYDDNQKRIVGGRNGYGAKLTNIYSSEFSVVIKDGEEKKTYTQKWSNNMTTCHPPKITKHSAATSSVSITFTPDWKRFGMKDMDINIYKIFEKRVWDANICTTNCKVKFQGEALPKITFEAYAKMHEGVTDLCSVTTDRWSVCVGPSENGLEQVSFVNGICTNKGGTHVDHVASHLASGIIDEMAKKIKLKPQQVKNTFNIFVRATLENPTFSSQVKSECTSKVQDFGSKFAPNKTFVKNALKTGIQDELLALSKFKEMKELSKTDGGARKSKITGIPKLDDANKAGTNQSKKCTLIITEGDSAKTLAVAGLSVVGRDHYGVFPLRGKCKNVRDASVAQLTGNQEFNDLKKILGLQQGRDYKDVSELRYGRLMIMTDADNDGSHIKGLILNQLHYFWPSLLKLGFVVSMVTPIIKATKASQTKSFYTDSAFRNWYGNGQQGWRIKYYKGLGTSTSKEAREYFKQIEDLTVKFEHDIMTDKSIVLAFDKKKADDRKMWLLESTAKDPSELEVPYGYVKQLNITDFVHKDLVNFSLADLKRSIAHVADGLKPSQRKVMYSCFQKNLTAEMKVAQLAAFVAEKSAYHHGEVSLADTIVKLANDYMGSNNINLLEPCGQFGTRLMGGKDASQTRYIFTRLTKQARKIFDPRDDAVLNYLDDDGRSIEPDFYMPTIPMVLVNGTEGIGTGFSCYVPPFNPKDIKDNIGRILDGKQVVPMRPWFRGFKGKVHKEDDTWMMEGVWNWKGMNIVVTELPPGRWTQDYKEYLEGLVEKKLIGGFTNNSTTEDVHFEIEDYTGKDLLKDLKLRKTFRVSNMHLFHPTRGIHKYSSPEEILKDFVELREDHYVKRKAHLIKVLETRATMCGYKSKFVTMVIEGDIVVFKRKKQDLEEELSKTFPKIGGTYDYLLNIKTVQYTEESVKDLLKESKQAKEELEVMKNTSHIEMWKMDIKNM